jgi:hypothetical protein
VEGRGQDHQSNLDPNMKFIINDMILLIAMDWTITTHRGLYLTSAGTSAQMQQ